MTPSAANTNHPYLRAEDFRDPTFIKVRRQVALLRLPYAQGRMRELLEDTVRVYTDILARRT
jgi:hypothetical protein